MRSQYEEPEEFTPCREEEETEEEQKGTKTNQDSITNRVANEVKQS